jgi:hypothetical protein
VMWRQRGTAASGTFRKSRHARLPSAKSSKTDIDGIAPQQSRPGDGLSITTQSACTTTTEEIDDGQKDDGAQQRNQQSANREVT